MSDVGRRLGTWAARHHAAGFDLMRMYLGVGLIVKSFFFMTHPDFLLQITQEADTFWPVPMALIHFVIPAHLVGGAMLLVGFFTRIAALAQIPILAGATFYVYMPKMMLLEPRQQLEFTALVLFLLILLLCFGAGPWSVDALIARRRLKSGPLGTVAV